VIELSAEPLAEEPVFPETPVDEVPPQE
jgi:hypothetical protein